MFTSDPRALQQKYRDEASQKYDSLIEPFRHLWKLDQPDWLSNRENIWKSIVEREMLDDGDDFVKSYWERLGRFFVKAKPRKSDDHLYEYIRLALTPFENPNELVEHFEKRNPSQKKAIHRELLFYADRMYRSVPQEFHRVELIATALFNKAYIGKTEPQGPWQTEELVVVDPVDFVYKFMGETRNHLDRARKLRLKELRKHHDQHYNGKERSFVEVSIDYFLSAFEQLMVDREGEVPARLLTKIQNGLRAIEEYKPDVKNEFKDAFVAQCRENILKNDLIADLPARTE
jgi:hypothetical protein